jgi:hypothetical protein
MTIDLSDVQVDKITELVTKDLDRASTLAERAKDGRVRRLAMSEVDILSGILAVLGVGEKL